MISILYEAFRHWSAKGSVYIISDFHFSDVDSFAWRKADGRLPKGIDSIEALDEYVIKKVNSVVGKNDTLVCLGDVGNVDCVRRLKAGHKVLLLGNHDGAEDDYKHRIEAIFAATDAKKTALMNTWDASYLRSHQQDLSSYKELKLFDEVYSGPLMISSKIILSHEPITPLAPYFVNLCGHVHSLPHEFLDDDGIKHYNFCLEAVDYTPKSLGKMIEHGLLSDVKNIHRVAIDAAIKRAQKRSKADIRRKEKAMKK